MILLTSDKVIGRLDWTDHKYMGMNAHLVSRVKCPSSCEVVWLLPLSVFTSTPSLSSLEEREETMSVFFLRSTSSKFFEAFVPARASLLALLVSYR